MSLQNCDILFISLQDMAGYIRPVLIFIISFLVVYLIIHFYLRHYENSHKLPLLTLTRKAIRTPLFLLFMILSFLIPLSLGNQDNTIIRHAIKILYDLIILVVAWLLIKAMSLVKHFMYNKFNINKKDNLKARKIFTQFRIVEQIAIGVIFILAISLILISFNGIRKIGISILASAGVIGIILGLAAQKLIGTFLAGVQLAITEPIRLDDVVIVENEWGWIEEINLTYVVIRIWDLRRLIVPANYFIEKPFQNWTRTSAEILGTVFIYTDYTVPVNALREEVTRLLKDNKLWNGKVNVVQVTDATDQTVEVRVLVSTEDSPTSWDLRVYLREKLIEFLQKNYPGSLPKSRVTITANNLENKTEMNDKRQNN